MPICRTFQNAAFEPEQLQAMGRAFEAVLSMLGIEDRNDRIAGEIAKTLIELAKRGEHDTEQLRDFTAWRFRNGLLSHPT